VTLRSRNGTGCNTRPVTALVTAAREAHGPGGAQRLLDALLASRLFLEAPERPGVMVVPTPVGPLTPVFSDLGLLAGQRGDVRWSSTTGADLLGLAPGADLLLDPGTDHAVVLRTSALQRAVHVARRGADRG